MKNKFILSVIMIAVIVGTVLLISGCAGPSGTATGRFYNVVQNPTNGYEMILEIKDADHTFNVTFVNSTETHSGTFEVNIDNSYTAYPSDTGSFMLVEVKNVGVFAMFGPNILAGVARGNYSNSQLGGVYNYVDFNTQAWGTIEVSPGSNTFNFVEYKIITPETKTVSTSEQNIPYTYVGSGIAEDGRGMRFFICPNGMMVISVGKEPVAIAFKQTVAPSVEQFDGSYIATDIISGDDGLITLEASDPEPVEFQLGINTGTGTMETIFNGALHFSIDTEPDIDSVFVMSPKKIMAGIIKDDTSYVNIIGAMPSTEVF